MPPMLFGGADATAANQDTIIGLLEGAYGRAQCDVGMAGSTTVIVSDDLAGYGDDYFNTGWQLCVILNDNNHGVAPENQWRDITDYVSATGTFTCAAFTANVEANDYIMVARDEIVKTFQSTQRTVCTMTYWSQQDDDITLTDVAAADHNLPNITIAGIPTGATILRVVAILKVALLRDTSTADNAINAATELAVDATNDYSSTVQAIVIPDNSWAVDVSTSPDRGGDMLIGSIDVKAEITGNGTFYGRLEDCACDGNNLLLKDVSWGLQVTWQV